MTQEERLKLIKKLNRKERLKAKNHFQDGGGVPAAPEIQNPQGQNPVAKVDLPEVEVTADRPGFFKRAKRGVSNLFHKITGTEDYTGLYDTKDQAYASARKAGEKDFIYHKMRYTTDLERDLSHKRNFKKAYRKAKRKGYADFHWNGKDFHTWAADDNIYGMPEYYSAYLREVAPNFLKNYMTYNKPGILLQDDDTYRASFLAVPHRTPEQLNSVMEIRKHPKHVGADFIAEYTHHKQWQDPKSYINRRRGSMKLVKDLPPSILKSKRNYILQWFQENMSDTWSKDLTLEDLDKDQLSAIDRELSYAVPGSLEYNAHEEWEPALKMQIAYDMSPKEIRAFQKILGVKRDGKIGPETYNAVLGGINTDALGPEALRDYMMAHGEKFYGDKHLESLYNKVISTRQPSPVSVDEKEAMRVSTELSKHKKRRAERIYRRMRMKQEAAKRKERKEKK